MRYSMKRKVVLHGPSTLTVSLPSDWVKINRIKRGDDVIVQEKDKSLLISPTSFLPKGLSATFSVGNNRRIGRSMITSFYRSGYDEVRIEYNQIEFIEDIQQILFEEIFGFEIVSHTKTECVLKDLSGEGIQAFHIVLRRVWFLLLDLATDLFNGIKNRDSNLLNTMSVREKSINRLTNYCIRTMIKQGEHDYHKLMVYYRFVRSLEELADCYKDFSLYILKQAEIKPSRVILRLLKGTNEQLTLFHSIFYKYYPDDAERLNRETQLLYQRMVPLFNSGIDAYQLHFLFTICKGIRNLISTIVELQIK